MKKSRKAKRFARQPASASVGPRFPGWAVVLMAVAVVAAGGFWWGHSRHARPQLAVAPPIQATSPTVPSEPPPVFQRLKGKWQRPDGGYIVEIRSVEPGGKMDAAYFNPRPINVAKAQAAQEGALTTVFVELRDVNYPGSTYNLAYEAENDQLKGIYYQAALQKKFEVYFDRMK